MPRFTYVLSDQTGKKESGSMSASNVEEVQTRLESTGKIIISITQEKKSALFSVGKPTMKLTEKMLFIKNLATMIKVGVTITEAIEITLDQTTKPAQKKMYEDILEQLRNGQSLANSLRQYEYIFSKLFINMIATGEEGGDLENTLGYLGLQLEKEYATRKKVISALIYPAVIVSMTIIIGIGIVVFIMPKVMGVFSSFDVVLPWTTRALMAASDFLTGQPLLALALGAGSGGLMYWLLKWDKLKSFWDSLFMKLPVLGGIIKAGNVARFSRTLHSLLEASVPITKALGIIADMLENYYYKHALLEARDKVEKGAGLGESLEVYPNLFPTLAVKILYVGEKTGSLDATSEKVAEMFEEEVDSRTKNLSTALEPFMMVFMGGLVGGIAMAIIAPIYQLPNLIGK